MNAIRTLLAVTWKELQIIARDRGGLAILFALPLVISSLYGATFRTVGVYEQETAMELDVCVVDQDAGAYGRQLMQALEGTGVLRLEALGEPSQAEERVAQGLAVAAIILPPDLTESIAAYEPVALEVITDPAEPEAAAVVTGILNQVVAELCLWGEAAHGVSSVLEESGVLAGLDPQARRAVEEQSLAALMGALNDVRQDASVAVVSETVGGTSAASGLKLYFALFFPGITVMFVFFIVGMAGSSLLAERDTGTLRRLLAAPVSRGTVILAKSLAYALLACVQVIVLFSVAHLAFGMPLGNSPLALVLLTALLGLVASAFGLMVAALARTPGQAGSIGTLLGFLMAGLGGCIAVGPTPATRSAGILRVLSRLTPQGNALEAYYTVMGEAGTLGDIGAELLALTGFLALFLAVGAWRFRDA